MQTPLRVMLALALLAPAGSAGAASTDPAPDRERAPESTLTTDLTYGSLSGTYGAEDTTHVQSMAVRLRWAGRRAEVRLTLPYLSVDGSDVVLVGGAPTRPGGPREEAREISESGPGDAKLRADYVVVEGGARRPWLSVLAEVKAPTADEEKGLGTGETDVRAGLGLMHTVGRFVLLADAAYVMIGDPAGVDYEDVTETGVGIAYRLRDDPARSLYLYLESRSHPIEGLEDRRDVLAGISQRFGAAASYVVSVAGIAGLTDTADDVGLNVSLGRRFPSGR